MSTTLPLPSSPHCVPTTTMLGMASTSEYAFWMLQDLTDRQHALRSIRKIHRDDLTRPGARVADDEGLTDALRPRVGERLLEPAADDIASDRSAQVTEPARQRERRGLVWREVDDEEVGPRQRHGHALRLHHRERPAHVEREADRRAVVPEATEHVVVAAAARASPEARVLARRRSWPRRGARGRNRDGPDRAGRAQARAREPPRSPSRSPRPRPRADRARPARHRPGRTRDSARRAARRTGTRWSRRPGESAWARPAGGSPPPGRSAA